MTRRERLELKIQKRREWAEKAVQRSEQRREAAQSMLAWIPLGQPILVGHHSEARHRRDVRRVDNHMRKSWEEAEKASSHLNKASTLETRLERSIFSDDPDAIEAIRAKIAKIEEERTRNSAAEIRRLKKRIEEISLRTKKQREAEEAGGALFLESNGYCSVTFAEKPERHILAALRGAGFRWSGGAWFGPSSKVPEEVKSLLAGQDKRGEEECIS